MLGGALTTCSTQSVTISNRKDVDTLMVAHCGQEHHRNPAPSVWRQQVISEQNHDARLIFVLLLCGFRIASSLRTRYWLHIFHTHSSELLLG